MPIIDVTWDKSGIATLETGKLKGALKRALKKAGATALRDMRSEASKRIRKRKAIRPKYVSRALTISRPRGGDIATLEWAVKIRGEAVPLIAYPHREIKGKTGKSGMGPRSAGGLSVEVNRGKRTILRGAFVATMKSGHTGIFRRSGLARLPIEELLGSRPVDALLHEGEAQGVADRGGASFTSTFARVLPLEIEKSK